MPLAHLIDAANLDYDDPREEIAARYDLIEGLQPEVNLKHREWVPTIYVDAERFPHDLMLDRVWAHYAQAHPGREFTMCVMRAQDLESNPISQFPTAERIFCQRGFVADVDIAAFTKGTNYETRYLGRNRSAAHFQLKVISGVIGGARSTRWSAFIDRHLGKLMGDCDGVPVPLVERDGVLLHRGPLGGNERIHHAHSRSLHLALQDAEADSYRLCSALPEEIAAQAKFERRNSRAFFDGASAAALILWQTQALAFLRKAAWQIEFITGPKLNTAKSELEVQKGRALRIVTRKPRGNQPPARLPHMPEPVLIAENQYRVEARDRLLEAGVNLRAATYIRGLETEEVVVATLHGATYQPELDVDCDIDRADPLRWLLPAARWLYELKHHHHATLDRGTARVLAKILNAFRDEPDDECPDLAAHRGLIEDRLGTPAWSVLSVVIDLMLHATIAEPMPVVYEWSRDPASPWKARCWDGAVVIEGPLLDFPVSQAEQWNAKAENLRLEAHLGIPRGPVRRRRRAR